VVIHGPSDSRGSRRELLAAGAAALAGGALAAGCGGSGRSKPSEGDASVALSDVPVLNRLLDVEYHAIAAYAAGIPLMSKPAAEPAILFLSQELAHAGSLDVLIRRAGAVPKKQRGSYNLGHPRTTAEVLALLHHVERLELAAYVQLIPRLYEGHVRAAAAAIFANDAQHIAFLRAQLGLEPSPAAFVTGSE
jgi:hypothetical protein